jgi:arabinofuranan 3-O-arabinosyltransferase
MLLPSQTQLRPEVLRPTRIAHRQVSPVAIISIGAIALLAIYVFGLHALYGQTPGWLIDSSGLPRASEYLGVRAAGELALHGQTTAAYDWAAHEALMTKITGKPATGYFPFPYPPTYLMVAAGLASLPYLASALLWIAATLFLYAWTVSRIAGARVAMLWAAASPATVFNAFVAHTGFWTAAAMGLAFDVLPKRPILAGVFLGLLAQKPQLGILVPIALIAGGYWRTCVSAGVTVGVLIVASIALFGTEPWLLYPRQMTLVSENLRFGDERFGFVNMNLLVTFYGFLRTCGVAESLALAVQLVLGAVMAVGIALLWRSRAPYALKAAGLASASLLATPYLFIYDLTHLSVAIAFLVRHTGMAGLTRAETILLCCAVPMILLTAFLPLPVSFVANAIVGAVVAARVWPFIELSRFGRFERSALNPT